MLGRLEAEESLRAYHWTALGNGSMDKDAAKVLLEGWATDANGGTTPTPSRGTVLKATPADLRAMKVGVRTVPKSAPTTES